MDAKTVLVTGGAGYIGSHTAIELLGAGHNVVVVDNFDNSSPRSVAALEKIAGRSVTMVQGDLVDPGVARKLFVDHPIDAVIHFAAYKAVGESVAQPLRYYRNNLDSTLNLLEAMGEAGCRRFVFSSSCTVYGNPEAVPITEDSPLAAVNPYGRTKLVNEEMLRDLFVAQPDWRISLLRYFNPVGAHPSGELGEDPRGVPQNLMPYLMQVGVGRLAKLQVYGDDYPTRDGTCIRDYIHVVDLALGHLAALASLDALGPGCRSHNLGTGTGTTVLEMVAAASAAVGHPLPYEIVARRPGDAMEVWADPTLANAELGWRATRTVADMCTDHWRWQSTHPNGFGD